MTNRALAIAGFAYGKSTIKNAVLCDDTVAMANCLTELGIDVRWDENTSTITVIGCDREIPNNNAKLDTYGSGTTMRFLTALVATGDGMFRLDGDARMRERPIHDLVLAMQEIGIGVIFANKVGYPPLTVHASRWPGGYLKISGSVSSQFASSLLLAGPLTTTRFTVELDPKTVSRPYIEMTLRMMKHFGATFQRKGNRVQFDSGLGYTGAEIEIEPDASTASYFFAAAAMTKGVVTVQGLNANSLQGDIVCLEMLQKFGCSYAWREGGVQLYGDDLHAAELDLRDASDLLPTLAVTATVAEGTTTISGIAHAAHKESDRVLGFGEQLYIHGIPVETDDGQMSIRRPAAALSQLPFEPLNDHRLAMAFALLGLVHGEVHIKNPGCVAKTFPQFWTRLNSLIGPAGGSATVVGGEEFDAVVTVDS